MKIGYLGVGNPSRDVAFEVDFDFPNNTQRIETFTNMKVTKQASYTTHKIHARKAVPEMTGLEADQITFNILLSAYLGVNPKKELDKLEDFMKNGNILNLVLGDQLFGRWVLKSMPYNVEYVYKEGDITQAKCTITLLEAGDD